MIDIIHTIQLCDLKGFGIDSYRAVISDLQLCGIDAGN